MTAINDGIWTWSWYIVGGEVGNIFFFLKFWNKICFCLIEARKPFLIWFLTLVKCFLTSICILNVLNWKSKWSMLSKKYVYSINDVFCVWFLFCFVRRVILSCGLLLHLYLHRFDLIFFCLRWINVALTQSNVIHGNFFLWVSHDIRIIKWDVGTTFKHFLVNFINFSLKSITRFTQWERKRKRNLCLRKCIFLQRQWNLFTLKKKLLKKQMWLIKNCKRARMRMRICLKVNNNIPPVRCFRWVRFWSGWSGLWPASVWWNG